MFLAPVDHHLSKLCLWGSLGWEKPKQANKADPAGHHASAATADFPEQQLGWALSPCLCFSQRRAFFTLFFLGMIKKLSIPGCGGREVLWVEGGVLSGAVAEDIWAYRPPSGCNTPPILAMVLQHAEKGAVVRTVGGQSILHRHLAQIQMTRLPRKQQSRATAIDEGFVGLSCGRQSRLESPRIIRPYLGHSNCPQICCMPQNRYGISAAQTMYS